MTNPTSNFGWQMPTSTDLVTDLPADFEVFGQAVDTSLAELKGGTTGQVLSKTSNTDMDFTWVTTDDANAIQNSIVDAKGDLIAASANDTPARLAVGNNGETLVADSSTATGLRYTALFGANKNKIINGDFLINQRGFTTSTSSGLYPADRTIMFNAGGTCTTSRQDFTPGAAPVAGYEGRNYLRTAISGQSASTDYYQLRQLIEDVTTFAGQTVTLSFWAKANSGTPSIAANFVQNFGTGGSPSSATFATTAQKTAITTSWARYSLTFAIASIAGKTLGTTANTSSLELRLYLSAGSAFNSETLTLGIQTNTFDLWGVQVEAGSIATPFQTATGTIQGELAACQRYYIQNALGVNFFTTGAVYSGTSARFTLPNPVTLRTTPTGLVTQNLTVSIPRTGGTVNTGTWAITYSTPNTTTVTYTHGTSVLTAGDVAEAYGNNANSYIGWSAEL